MTVPSPQPQETAAIAHAPSWTSKSLPAEAVLQFTGVGKTFRDGTMALAGVTFSVPKGEFVSIVGPSGCGKSTLLRMASGLSAPTKGRILSSYSSLGYVFQDATLLPWRTVENNVELVPLLNGVPKEARRELVRKAIDLVGLGGFEQHYPRTLSGGMAMRTSLARALTLEPDLFLFDEPFGSLDAITRERLNEELLQLYQSQRFTGVFVTHSIAEAVYLSRRVVVMCGRPGRVVAEVEVPFDYPRALDVRFTTEFSELSKQVSESLREVYQ
jgi:NitT/TauT family transport system ATP-binding protein